MGGLRHARCLLRGHLLVQVNGVGLRGGLLAILRVPPVDLELLHVAARLQLQKRRSSRDTSATRSGRKCSGGTTHGTPWQERTVTVHAQHTHARQRHPSLWEVVSCCRGNTERAYLGFNLQRAEATHSRRRAGYGGNTASDGGSDTSDHYDKRTPALHPNAIRLVCSLVLLTTTRCDVGRPR